ncbi:unnamed protein product [Oppiella nova]|uniref:Uncharacterized protein n=1 Tax=Oppiella nova TaxID=334625 RepID=A0A7R9LS31_9ACAR|nr:unnamed protein product [Oppiella nova]CAG2165817.1 unnamed protein product [Oppiella nova]
MSVCSAYAASTNGIVSLATNTKSNGNNLKDYNTCILTVVLSGKCGDIPMPTDPSDRNMCNAVYQLTDCIKSNDNRVTLGVCTASERDDVDKNFDSIEVVCKQVNNTCFVQPYTRRWCKDNGYNSTTFKLIVKTKDIELPIDFLKATAGFSDDHDDIYYKKTDSLEGAPGTISQPIQSLVPVDDKNFHLCENHIIEIHAKPSQSKNSESEVDQKCTGNQMDSAFKL